MRTRVGYTGGSTADPTYYEMGDHTESFQVDFDPSRVSYEQLVERFWAAHWPQERAYGRQYMAAAWWANDAQRRVLEASRDRIAQELGHEVHTVIAPLEKFYEAEGYHQKYYLRRHKELMREFEAYDERAFIDSAVAAKLNGYVGGGRAEKLDEALAELGISEGAAERVKKLARRG